MSFEVWPEDRRMSSPLCARYGPRNPATPGLPRPHDLLRNVPLQTHRNLLPPVWRFPVRRLRSRDTVRQCADAGTARRQQILRAVVAARSGVTTIVRFESNRAASQESSSHRHADERVDRRRSAGGGYGYAASDGVGVGATATAARQDRPGPGRDQYPDAQRLFCRGCQEPGHRAALSRPEHQVCRGDDSCGGLASHWDISPRRAWVVCSGLAALAR
jgi:hypothetical protein